MSLGEASFGGSGGGKGDGDGRGVGFSLSAAAISAAALFRAPLARRGAGIGAFVLAIVTAGALTHVGVRLKGLEVAYDLGRERRIATEMEEQRRRLQIEIGMLKDPRRVIAIAKEKLNMGPPAPEAIWRLGSGGQVSEWPMLSSSPGSTTGQNAVSAAKISLPKPGATALVKPTWSARPFPAVTAPVRVGPTKGARSKARP